MKARFLFAAVAALLVLGLAGPASAAPVTDAWHRLNPFTDAGAPEHERLTCAAAGAALHCRYDKIPGSGLVFDETTGHFTGHDITGRWTCPDWFEQDLCEGVTQVYVGQAVYFPEDGRPFPVRQEYVIAEIDGQEVLMQHWVGAFACPWFGTFAEAVAANPTAQGDCLVAP